MRDSRLILRTVGYAVLGALVMACASGCTSTSSSSSSSDAPPRAEADGGTVIPGTGPVGGIVVPPGTKCTKDLECGNGRCVEGACVPGSACVDDTTCNGGHCVAGGCVPATATDGVKNGDETGVDCGGSVAPRCADGLTCLTGPDCVSKVCTGGVCQAPTATDGVQNGDETAMDCGGATAPKCAPGLTCKLASDCDSGICGADGTCTAPTSSDGVKNGTETDIDCGGGAPTNAPMCATGKGCAATTDCVWGHCNAGVCGGHVPGTKDGDQTDIDCGGKMSPACDWYLSCLVNADCGSGVCDSTKHCAVSESCRSGVHGIATCGVGEVGDAWKNHETCCKSLPVPGYADPDHAGKTTYLDKYEITSGRLRAFITAISAANGGVPDIQTYTKNHRPAVKWNAGWEDNLPQSTAGTTLTYAVAYPLPGVPVKFLYPGEDQYLANHPTQSTWWIRGTGPADTSQQHAGQTGNYTVDTGLYNALTSSHFFPEYYASGWPQGTDYAAGHAYNCYNGYQSYAWNTYWFDPAIITAYTGDPVHGGGVMVYPQDIYDEKAANCTPNSLFAAFCAWDGGQLATGEVMDYITGNTVQPIYDGAYPNGLYASRGGATQCGSVTNTLNTFPDGGTPCYNVYFYPGFDNVPAGLPHAGELNSYDSSARIAPPGRIAADTIVKAPNVEPWMDMIGNLEEAVMKKGETTRFDYRGFGAEYSSITHHRNQQSTPRYKAGSFGARCMRFK